MANKNEVINYLQVNKDYLKNNLNARKIGVKNIIPEGTDSIDLIVRFEEDEQVYKNYLAFLNLVEDEFKTNVELISCEQLIAQLEEDNEEIIYV